MEKRSQRFKRFQNTKEKELIMFLKEERVIENIFLQNTSVCSKIFHSSNSITPSLTKNKIFSEFFHLLSCCTSILVFLNRAKGRIENRKNGQATMSKPSLSTKFKSCCTSILVFLNRAKAVLIVKPISTHPSFSGSRYAEFFIFKKS